MHKSKISHAVLDLRSRYKKAKKIISILENFIDLKQCKLLDIGTGSGHIINEISKKCKSASSVDLYDERMIKTGYRFKKVHDEKLPFPDHTFDVIISNHVIEHIPNQSKHISEMHRVLKKEGIVYLATPNKYWPLDPHHNLLFISWLPRNLSSSYSRIFSSKKWNIFPLSYGHLRKLTKNKFNILNITLKVLKDSKKYHIDTLKIIHSIIKLVPTPILKMFNSFIPSYILILKKK